MDQVHGAASRSSTRRRTPTPVPDARRAGHRDAGARPRWCWWPTACRSCSPTPPPGSSPRCTPGGRGWPRGVVPASAGGDGDAGAPGGRIDGAARTGGLRRAATRCPRRCSAEVAGRSPGSAGRPRGGHAGTGPAGRACAASSPAGVDRSRSAALHRASRRTYYSHRRDGVTGRSAGGRARPAREPTRRTDELAANLARSAAGSPRRRRRPAATRPSSRWSRSPRPSRRRRAPRWPASACTDVGGEPRPGGRPTRRAACADLALAGTSSARLQTQQGRARSRRTRTSCTPSTGAGWSRRSTAAPARPAARSTCWCRSASHGDRAAAGRDPADVPALADAVAAAEPLALGGRDGRRAAGADPARPSRGWPTSPPTVRAAHPEATVVSAGMSGDLEEAVAARRDTPARRHGVARAPATAPVASDRDGSPTATCPVDRREPEAWPARCARWRSTSASSRTRTATTYDEYDDYDERRGRRRAASAPGRGRPTADAAPSVRPRPRRAAARAPARAAGTAASRRPDILPDHDAAPAHLQRGQDDRRALPRGHAGHHEPHRHGRRRRQAAGRLRRRSGLRPARHASSG